MSVVTRLSFPELAGASGLYRFVVLVFVQNYRSYDSEIA